jgi:hypothetical protein
MTLVVTESNLGARFAAPDMSNYREKLIEHVFIAEVLQECAFVRNQVVEVLHAEVDAGGYDLVLQMGDVIRHVQLKTRFKSAVGRKVIVNANLEQHRGGCVVWMFWDVDPATHRASLTYRWFGDGPRQRTKPLPATVGTNPRGGTTRPNTRVMKWGDFEPTQGAVKIGELVTRLFGNLPR